MSFTKRQFIVAALTEIGLGSYDIDLSNDQMEQALNRLDALMAEWNNQGIYLSYPLPSSPEASNIHQETNVPDAANEAIITNLALRLSPSYGKAPNMLTTITAKNAHNRLLAKFSAPTELQKTAQPAGAGHKGTNVYTQQPKRKLVNDTSGLDFN